MCSCIHAWMHCYGGMCCYALMSGMSHPSASSSSPAAMKPTLIFFTWDEDMGRHSDTAWQQEEGIGKIHHGSRKRTSGRYTMAAGRGHRGDTPHRAPKPEKGGTVGQLNGWKHTSSTFNPPHTVSHTGHLPNGPQRFADVR